MFDEKGQPADMIIILLTQIRGMPGLVSKILMWPFSGNGQMEQLLVNITIGLQMNRVIGVEQNVLTIRINTNGMTLHVQKRNNLSVKKMVS